jgi:S1-C subfamily serine protease
VKNVERGSAFVLFIVEARCRICVGEPDKMNTRSTPAKTFGFCWTLCVTIVATVGGEREFNTVMMLNTFEIRSPKDESLGTGFLIAKPRHEGSARLKVLVTADHVFSSNTWDTVTIVGRQQLGQSNWEIRKVPLKIREGEKRLWQKSPVADVGAIYCEVPDPPVWVGFELLATDDFWAAQEIHPGDPVFVLGYPLGFSGNQGFPILRSGVISSYPLTPTRRYGVFDIAFTVFPGNSGGPVYIVDRNRAVGGSVVIGQIQGILGLVIQSKQNVVSQEIIRKSLSEESIERSIKKTPLDVAVVVHASLIKELVESMPEP